MSRPTFLYSVVLGLLVSIVAAAACHALMLLFSVTTVLQVLIALTSLYSVGQTIWITRNKTGLVTAFTCWLAGSLALFSFEPSTALFLASQLLFIWLVRSLYVYTSLLSALLDFGVCVISYSVVVWTADYTGSVFLTFWCFFLSQATVSAIPISFTRALPTPRQDASFERAYRVAAQAVNQLATQTR